MFEWLRDSDFEMSGIDIAARRAAHHAMALSHQAQHILDGAGLSANGRAKLGSLESIDAVRGLDARTTYGRLWP